MEVTTLGIILIAVCVVMIAIEGFSFFKAYKHDDIKSMILCSLWIVIYMIVLFD